MTTLSDSRQYMEHHIGMWLRNDQTTHELCTGVAMDAATLLIQGDVHAPDHEVHHAAGEAVASQLIDWIERIGERAGHHNSTDGPAVTMLGLLKDLLDVGDSQLWAAIGEDFLSDWERPVICSASDCEELATDDDGHCDDCRNLSSEPQHANYPHEPGRLHDCAACEARCHCDNDPGTTVCVYSGPHDHGKVSDS